MSPKVAIIGGGPAGAVCGYYLARTGFDVLIFERQPQREKPCGGGLTLRALKALPGWPDLEICGAKVHQLILISPNRRRIDLELKDPIHVISRRRLDDALRQMAVSAGATLVTQTAREPRPSSSGGWQVNGLQADIIVGAGGINDPVARHQGLSCPVKRRGQAVGYFVRGTYSQRIVCRFFPDLWGYAWWFPRPDHASLGIELLGDEYTSKKAFALIRQFVREDLDSLILTQGKKLDLAKAEPYAWAEPIPDQNMLATRKVNGYDWLLVGDAAGLVDSITGEGLPYALMSGSLAAKAIQSGRLEMYAKALKKKIWPDLLHAARWSSLFYWPPLLRLSLFVLAKSRTMQAMTEEMAMGHQHYHGFKRRLFLYAPWIAKDLVRSKKHG